MFPFHLRQASSTVNYMEEFHDDGQGSHLPPLALAAGRAPPFPCASFFNIRQDHGDHRLHRQEEGNDQSFNSATSRCRLISRPQDDDADGRNLKLSLCDHYVKEEEEEVSGGAHTHAKWTPSEMRIMRKMMKADRTAVSRTRRQTKSAQDSIASAGYGNISPCGSDVVRVCSDCHTTKTPLWRSGPCGPKSLCNACGIRQRKARRAMAAAAAAAANGSRLIPSPPALTKARKEKKPHIDDVDDDRSVPFKKRCKFARAETADQRKLCFEDVTLTLGTSSTSSTHRPFPQDERDAAILLMALSCGLVRS